MLGNCCVVVSLGSALDRPTTSISFACSQVHTSLLSTRALLLQKKWLVALFPIAPLCNVVLTQMAMAVANSSMCCFTWMAMAVATTNPSLLNEL